MKTDPLERLKTAAQAMISCPDQFVTQDFHARATPAAILSLIAQVEALTVPQCEPCSEWPIWSQTNHELSCADYDLVFAEIDRRMALACAMKAFVPDFQSLPVRAFAAWDGNKTLLYLKRPDWANTKLDDGGELVSLSDVEKLFAPTISAIPGTKEGA